MTDSPIIREEIIGQHRLILGDCLNVMPLLGRFDAVVTDPPYGIIEIVKKYERTAKRFILNDESLDVCHAAIEIGGGAN